MLTFPRRLCRVSHSFRPFSFASFLYQNLNHVRAFTAAEHKHKLPAIVPAIVCKYNAGHFPEMQCLSLEKNPTNKQTDENPNKSSIPTITWQQIKSIVRSIILSPVLFCFLMQQVLYENMIYYVIVQECGYVAK